MLPRTIEDRLRAIAARRPDADAEEIASEALDEAFAEGHIEEAELDLAHAQAVAFVEGLR